MMQDNAVLWDMRTGLSELGGGRHKQRVATGAPRGN